jgi:hypothetical protein
MYDQSFQKNPNDSLDQLPFYLRDSVQNIVDKKVQKRVQEEMAML